MMFDDNWIDLLLFLLRAVTTRLLTQMEINWMNKLIIIFIIIALTRPSYVVQQVPTSYAVKYRLRVASQLQHACIVIFIRLLHHSWRQRVVNSLADSTRATAMFRYIFLRTIFILRWSVGTIRPLLMFA